jgi:hypothetical protein
MLNDQAFRPRAVGGPFRQPVTLGGERRDHGHDAHP